MRPVPRIPETNPGTLHPLNPHRVLGLNLCIQMLPPQAPPHPLPGLHPSTLNLQDLTQPFSSLLAFGMLQILPTLGHFLDTPKSSGLPPIQISPNL